MKRYLSFLYLFLLMPCAIANGGEKVMDNQTQTSQPAALAGPDLRDRALAVLRGALAEPPGWEKIHAAEALLTLKYGAGVTEAIERDLQAVGDRPQYRIGLWRMRALAEREPARRQPWLDRIRAALFDPQGPDRVHAAEALAKLRYQPRDAAELQRLQETARTATDGVAVYTQWALANAGRPEAVRTLDGMLDSKDSVERCRAAYALGRLEGLNAETRKKLAAAADCEPAGSEARVYLLGSALAQAGGPEDAMPLKASLRRLALEGDKANKYAAATALADHGGADDLPILAQLLAHEILDVRVSAARAILCIGQRGSASPKPKE